MSGKEDFYSREQRLKALRDNRIRQESLRTLQESMKECSFQPNARKTSRTHHRAAEQDTTANRLESPTEEESGVRKSDSNFNRYVHGGGGFLVTQSNDKMATSVLQRSGDWLKNHSFSSTRVPWDTGEPVTSRSNPGPSPTHERLYRQKTFSKKRKEIIINKQLDSMALDGYRRAESTNTSRRSSRQTQQPTAESEPTIQLTQEQLGNFVSAVVRNLANSS